MTHHVFATPTYATSLGDPIDVGKAETIEEAVALIQAKGFVILGEDDGGTWEKYGAEDAPGIYGYEPDGLGAFSVTVVPQ